MSARGLAEAISAENRRTKWGLFLDTVRPDVDLSVLDVGFGAAEYSEVDNYLEKYYPWQDRITALGIDGPEKFVARYPLVNAVQYGGGEFPFPDKSFDVCWSNAVLEHVGVRDRQILFLVEIARVSKLAFVSTPNRRFPIEVHTRTPLLHLLPKPVFEAYLRLVHKGWATGDYMNLLSRSELESLLKDAGITEYRIVPNTVCGLVVDFAVMFGDFEIGRRNLG